VGDPRNGYAQPKAILHLLLPACTTARGSSLTARHKLVLTYQDYLQMPDDRIATDGRF
jgi:hypothetical protein